MSANTVTKLPIKIESGTRVRITPELAARLLEANKLNRPLASGHAERIASQIIGGKWRFNGDTIKISTTGDVLDGQHRLYAVVESNMTVDSIIVYGIEKDAFSTIDTIRKPRSLGDTVALSGNARYRNAIGTALAWLLRWERGCLETYRAPQNRIENSDVEHALKVNPGIVRAVERAMSVRSIANAGMMGFLFYIVVNRNEKIGEQMMNTLGDPAGVGVTDPFFRLRHYFIFDHHKKKNPITSIAIAFKAINAAAAGKKVQVLNWRDQGKFPETFPMLSL